MYISDVVVVTDDSRLAAAFSSALAAKGIYTAVLECPRVHRPDAENEIARVMNVLARLKPRLMILGTEDDLIIQQLTAQVQGKTEVLVFSDQNMDYFNYAGVKLPSDISEENAAIKLAQLFYQADREVAVLCDDTSSVSSVIAANYAIAHNADFYQTDITEASLSEISHLLENISDTEDRRTREIDIESLREEIAKHLPPLVHWAKYSKILFITKGAPYGIAMPASSTIHSPTLNIGQLLASNIYEAEWAKRRRAGVIGLFVQSTDFDTTQEQSDFEDALTRARGYYKQISTRSSKITEYEIETFPYDILYLATHGSQVRGSEVSYPFKGDDGRDHEIVTHEAEGVTGRVFFIHSVDGIEKISDAWGTAQGQVWGEFVTLLSKPETCPIGSIGQEVMLPMRELLLGDDVGSGMGSTASFHRIASQQRPLAVVNACGSWVDLSGRFIFAGASAYIGTLWPIRNSVARKFAAVFFPKLFEVDLVGAFHAGRSELEELNDQITYIFSGTFESRFDPLPAYDVSGLDELKNRLHLSLGALERSAQRTPKVAPDVQRSRELDKWYFDAVLSEISEEHS